MKPGVRSQVVDVPVRSCGQLLMVGDPGTQATRPQCAPHVNVIPELKLHRSQVPDLNAGIARAREYQCICPGLRINGHSGQSLFEISLLVLVKWIERNMNDRMATWKVIQTVSGNIEAVSARLLKTGREPTSGLSGEA